MNLEFYETSNKERLNRKDKRLNNIYFKVFIVNFNVFKKITPTHLS